MLELTRSLDGIPADGFDCQCDTCTLPPEPQRASDVRRVAAQLLDEEAGQQRPPQDRLRLLHLRLRLLEQERLMGPDRARSLYDCVQVCLHALEDGDEDEEGGQRRSTAERQGRFKKYARLASAEFARGGNSVEAARLQAMAGDERETSPDVLAEIWAELNADQALGFASAEERSKWDNAKLKDAESQV